MNIFPEWLERLNDTDFDDIPFMAASHATEEPIASMEIALSLVQASMKPFRPYHRLAAIAFIGAVLHAQPVRDYGLPRFALRGIGERLLQVSRTEQHSEVQFSAACCVMSVLHRGTEWDPVFLRQVRGTFEALMQSTLYPYGTERISGWLDTMTKRYPISLPYQQPEE